MKQFEMVAKSSTSSQESASKAVSIMAQVLQERQRAGSCTPEIDKVLKIYATIFNTDEEIRESEEGGPVSIYKEQKQTKLRYHSDQSQMDEVEEQQLEMKIDTAELELEGQVRYERELKGKVLEVVPE